MGFILKPSLSYALWNLLNYPLQTESVKWKMTFILKLSFCVVASGIIYIFLVGVNLSWCQNWIGVNSGPSGLWYLLLAYAGKSRRICFLAMQNNGVCLDLSMSESDHCGWKFEMYLFYNMANVCGWWRIWICFVAC